MNDDERDELAELDGEEPRRRVLWKMNAPYGLQEDGTYKLLLENPFKFDPQGEEIEVLHFHRPRGKDFRDVPPEPKTLDPWMRFGARLCRVPNALVDKLEGVDASRFVEVSTNFFGGSPETIGSVPSGT